VLHSVIKPHYMIKTLSIILFCSIIIRANGQTNSVKPPPEVKGAQPYGQVDIADLEMKQCDFEPDANAEVLFDVGKITFSDDLLKITNEVHKRIKIFSEKGGKEANIRIEYFPGNQFEYIRGIEAETINLVNGKPEVTKLDKKLIFTKVIDNSRSEIDFALPNVKPGSIIEYKYQWNSAFYNMPVWFFQDNLPVRYNELKTSIPEVFYFREHFQGMHGLTKIDNKTESATIGRGGGFSGITVYVETRIMANEHSLPDEPFMSSFVDNVHCVIFQLVSIKSLAGFSERFSDTWAKVGGILADADDFGGQLKRSLGNEQELIVKAKAFKNDEDKISYLFNRVRDAMKWNEIDCWYTVGGTVKAWEKKVGTSAEIKLTTISQPNC